MSDNAGMADDARKTLESMVASWRYAGRLIADEAWRWAYRLHAPFDINGDQARAVCVWCKEDWPCRGTQRLDASREKAGHEFLS